MSRVEDQDGGGEPPASGGRGSAAAGLHHEPRRTRFSAAWVAIVVAVVLGAALVDFLAENTREVRVHFFSLSGQMPIAVALLASALAGAVVVVAVGVGRVAQLRLSLRRQRRRSAADVAGALDDGEGGKRGDASPGT